MIRKYSFNFVTRLFCLPLAAFGFLCSDDGSKQATINGKPCEDCGGYGLVLTNNADFEVEFVLWTGTQTARTAVITDSVASGATIRLNLDGIAASSEWSLSAPSGSYSQSCRWSQRAGTFAEDFQDSINASYDCHGKKWGQARELTSGPTDAVVSDFAVAYSPNGHGLAIVAADSTIYAAGLNEFEPDTSMLRLSVDNGKAAGRPSAAFNSNGDALVVWSQADSTGPPRIVYAERRDYTWSIPETISEAALSPEGFPGIQPRVAYFDDGSAVVGWTGFDGLDVGTAKQRIYVAERDAAGDWSKPGDEADSVTDGTYQASELKLAFHPAADSALLTWLRSDGTTNQLYKAEWRAGAWELPASDADTVNPAGALGNPAKSHNVSMDEQGRAAIVWQQENDADDAAVFIATFDGADWSLPADLADYVNVGGQPAYAPCLALSATRSVAAWHQYNNYRDAVFYGAAFENAAWQWPADLNATLSDPLKDDSFGAACALDSNGRALIAYRQTPETEAGLYYAFGDLESPQVFDDEPIAAIDAGSEIHWEAFAIDNGDAGIYWLAEGADSALQVWTAQYR